MPVHDLQMCNAVAAVPAAQCCCLFPAWSRGFRLSCETNTHYMFWSLWHYSLAPARHSQRKKYHLKESASEPCLPLCCPGPQQDFCVHSRYLSCASNRSQPYLQHLQKQPTSLSSKLAAFQSREFIVSGSCWFTFWKWGKIWNGGQKSKCHI